MCFSVYHGDRNLWEKQLCTAILWLLESLDNLALFMQVLSKSASFVQWPCITHESCKTSTRLLLDLKTCPKRKHILEE